MALCQAPPRPQATKADTMKAKPLPNTHRPLVRDRREQQFARGARQAHRIGVPQFLARLVGLDRARHLCRDTPIPAHHD